MNTTVNMDALLDGKLDDLADLPTFKPYPAGVHKAIITMVPKMVNDKLVISLDFKYVSLVELGDPGTPKTPTKVPDAGDIANTLCQMDNEFGQGLFKKVRTALQPSLGLDNATSHKDFIAKANGTEVQIVTKVRTNKTTGIDYLNLVDIAVV